MLLMVRLRVMMSFRLEDARDKLKDKREIKTAPLRTNMALK